MSRKSPTRLTEEKWHEVCRRYMRAKKSEKKAIAARYNVSMGAITGRIAQGFGEKLPKKSNGKSDVGRQALRTILEELATGKAMTVDVAEATIMALVGARAL